MSINKELSLRLLEQQEEEKSHVEYSHEYGYYENVAAGDVGEVKKVLADPSDTSLYDGAEYGKLSVNRMRNMRYHFVVSTALITRLCVEKGLEREMAYTLSDLYISKMDLLSEAEDIIRLHNEMLMDFTERMSKQPKRSVYSMQVIKAMEYIYKHRTGRLTSQMVAEAVGVNRSYLSTVFHKESGITLQDFIRREKIKAAANMLRFSDYSYSEIAEYFGFSSQSHFIQCFKKECGLTPKEYRLYSLNSNQAIVPQPWNILRRPPHRH